MPSISVVIPVYRSQDSIGLVVKELAAELPKLTDAFEAVLVEDSGGDGSWDVIQKLSAEYDWLRGFRLMRNYGQHNALLCGIRAARFEVIVTMDDDLQHPTARIKDLLDKLAEGYDVVYGRPAREQHGLWRNLASLVSKAVLQGAMGAKTARGISAFRAFRTSLRQSFADFQGPFVSIDVLLTWGTSNFVAIAVPHAPRTIGASNYTFGKLVAHTFNMATGFSTLPLRFASLLGLMMTVFGFLLFMYIIVIRVIVFQYEVPGFTFISSIISIFAGAQMFTLGIIGEYLARIHLRSMDKPPYVVEETLVDEWIHENE